MDESLREAWVAEAAAQARKRLTGFEEDIAQIGERAREVYEDGESTLVEAVDTLEGQFSEEDPGSRG